MKRFVLIAGLLLLVALEILHVYFIMPFPGSQKKNTIDLAYWIDRNIVWLRIVLLLLIAYPAIQVFKNSRRWKKVVLGVGLIFYAFVFYMFNFKFLAEKMFYQPNTKTLVGANINKVGLEKLVIGVSMNGEAKAYPIQIIGYHHQVRDTVGNTPVMVTYCTVCRTGRVFSPTVNGNPETFRLVGMDHFNAMFEDASTKSWWRQVTGVAVAGPLKGTALKELPSQQTTLGNWLRLHPDSKVLQPDTAFNKQYADLELFDKGTIKSGLEKRDSGSWKMKSWVVGVENNQYSKAYDWNRLVTDKIIQDSVGTLPVLVALASDTVNFYVLDRRVENDVLSFQKALGDTMVDIQSNSKWTIDGLAVSGPYYGKRLARVQSYQEFWHSWQTFHPNTTKY